MTNFPEAKVVKQFKTTTSLIIPFSSINDKASNLEFNKEEIDYLQEKQKNKEQIAVLNKYHRFVFVLFNSDLKASNPSEWYRKQGAAVESVAQKERIDTLGIEGFAQAEALHIAEGIALAAYRFNRYFKDKAKKENHIKRIHLNQAAVTADALEELMATVAKVWVSRTWVNEPQSHLNAVQFAKEIRKEAEAVGIEVEIWNKEKIEAEKMGGLLAVNRGSEIPPVFAILHWKPKKASNKKPIVLVGKGVVYDTGGLSLKPTANSMDIMKCDMGGAAAVVGAILSVAANKLDKEVYCLVPLTDNRPGKDAYAPGDVVTMYDGTTVEVLNTDAEGRMILADALAYAKKLKPEITLDAATLTGAAERAIGVHASCVMGNAKGKVFKQLQKSGEDTFERVVEFPFWEEYYEDMKSTIADLKNIGGGTAGMITAGKFLEHFAPSPYVHIDIAGPAFVPKADAYRPKGGTGYGVRLLYNFIKNYPA